MSHVVQTTGIWMQRLTWAATWSAEEVVLPCFILSLHALLVLLRRVHKISPLVAISELVSFSTTAAKPRIAARREESSRRLYKPKKCRESMPRFLCLTRNSCPNSASRPQTILVVVSPSAACIRRPLPLSLGKDLKSKSSLVLISNSTSTVNGRL